MPNGGLRTMHPAEQAEDLAPAVLEVVERPAMMRTMTISQATDLWLGAVDLSERAEATYRRFLDKFADDHPNHLDVDEITLTQIRNFLERQSKLAGGGKKSSATIAQQISIICRFFDWLSKEGIVARNPTRRNGDRVIDRPRQTPPEDNDNVTTISGEDARKLLATAATMDWPERLAVNVAVYTGARRRALCTLRVRDYDPAGRRLMFQEKGSKSISKPVPHELAHLLDAAIVAGVYESDDDYLIPSRASQRKDGDRDDRVIWKLIKDVAAKAGVRTHVHALRAAFAVHYLESNPGGLIALQKLMGHQRGETTQVYLRRLDRQQQMETVRDLSWGTHGSGLGTTEEGAEGTRLPVSEGERPSLALRSAGSYAQAVGAGEAGLRPQIAEELLESLPLTEKEGFEPSFAEKAQGKRVGFQNEGSAPGEGDDEPPGLSPGWSSRREGTPGDVRLGVEAERPGDPSTPADRRSNVDACSLPVPGDAATTVGAAHLDAALAEKVRAITSREKAQ